MRLRIAALAPSLVVAATVTATSATAQVGDVPNRNTSFYHGHEMMWGGDYWGGFGMVLGPIFMLLILVAIVVGVIYVLRLFGGADVVGNGQPAHARAMALLKERFAKGEIDTKEFEERKKLLAD